MRKRYNFLKNSYTALIMFFLYAPILVLIAFSFNKSKSRALWTGFTFDWYREVFSNEKILTALGNTLIIAVCSALIATVIGTLGAIGINSMRKWAKTVVLNITYLPIINPEIVIGVSLMLLFVSAQRGLQWFNTMMGTSLSLEMGFVTLLLAHVTFGVPYVILNVLPKLRQMDKHVYEAAVDLGCPPVMAFLKVVIPEIMPGIISGMLMAFTFSLDDFVISYFVTGPKFQTLPIEIYAMTRRKVSPEINALTTIIFIVVMVALMLSNYIEAKRERDKKQAYE